MLIDTHCHINILIKKDFDTPLEQKNIQDAAIVLKEALQHDVTTIINVGTSLIESQNCIQLAQQYPEMYAAIGIHPNDCTSEWKNDFSKIAALAKHKEENKVVAIGETGLDRHYPDYDIQRQKDAFKAQIELSLEQQLPLVIHTRDAHDEVLTILDEYRYENIQGVIHCFSEDKTFAQHAIDLNFVLGIGGPLTYPKNDMLREVFKEVPLDKVILETDTPFLPPQIIRGKQNHPKYIKTIAEYLAKLRDISFETVAKTTTQTAKGLFSL